MFCGSSSIHVNSLVHLVISCSMCSDASSAAEKTCASFITSSGERKLESTGMLLPQCVVRVAA